MTWLKKAFPSSLRAQILSIILIISLAALIELLMGRIPICKCGYVSLWYGDTTGPGNSQHLSDWYTFSHIIHGMLFYAFLWLIARKLPVRSRFVLAILLEAAWEILENSPLIINRYRAVTISFDYVGDSVINSVMDIVWAGLGFFLANKFPVWLTLAAIIFMEVLAAYVVRDNLTLNIIMLVFPSEAIKIWQAAI